MTTLVADVLMAFEEEIPIDALNIGMVETSNPMAIVFTTWVWQFVQASVETNPMPMMSVR